MVFNRKGRKFNKKTAPKTRKELRKEKRKEKKLKKHEYFQKIRKGNRNEHNAGKSDGRGKHSSLLAPKDLNSKEKSKSSGEDLNSLVSKGKSAGRGKYCNSLDTNGEISNECTFSATNDSPDEDDKVPSTILRRVDDVQKQIRKERREQRKLENAMKKQRQKQMKESAEMEEKTIKRLEKQLNLNKRKSKSIPKSFVADGLDYLLEVCDNENLRKSGTALLEENVENSGSDFDEDFAAVTGKSSKTLKNLKGNNQEKSDKDNFDYDKNDYDSDEEDLTFEENVEDNHDEDAEEELDMDMGDDSDGNDSSCSIDRGDSEDERMKSCSKRKRKYSDSSVITNENKENTIDPPLKKSKSSRSKNVIDENITEKLSEKKGKCIKTGKSVTFDIPDESGITEENEDSVGGSTEDQSKEFWEDIYGRKRDTEGNVVQDVENKYVPPHLRNSSQSNDPKVKEKLLRLKKQMKGLLNRLAESNMNSIASQVEELYMKNSRSDTNQTLTNLLLESLVAPVLTPERLIMEHMMLVAILHANVGTEIGTHVMQVFVKKFDEMQRNGQEVENKELDNVILVIAHMYNFKVFNVLLLYNILDRLTDKFEEKEVELILLILKSVGFSLRKDDPISLKDLILRIQQKASSAEHLQDNSRVKFMLDVLLAIKNNNMNKIPNYDPSYGEHLKKLLKGLLRKGNYITEVKISLEDLLKADERGRWWVVGSAWSGGEKSSIDTQKPTLIGQAFSSELLELARKQRMNTDVRKNIFCILMTAEDFLDAFEKLLKLGLKNQQEREIIHVIVHCCLQEKKFNPYYGHLANKFCNFDRKYQMMLQYHLWDKFKELQNTAPLYITNLAQFLIHLFIEKALPLSILKVLHLAEIDKPTVRFLRQVLMGLLLVKSEEDMLEVFGRIAISRKLHLFREGLRVFIKHFVLKNTKSVVDDNIQLLRERAEMVDNALTVADSRRFFD